MYKTSNFILASALIVKGFSPRERIKEEKTVYFVFDKTPELDEIVENFFNNRLPLDALTLGTAIRNIKKSIYELD